jgi:exodeoxyribonuclease V gamma subunit
LPTTDPLKSNTFAASPVTQIKPVPEQIDISQLLKFWNHPVRYFLEQRLGLQLRTGDNTLPESEPFDLDSLQSYLISDTIIPKMNASQELTPLFDRLLAEGEFPVAGQGTIIRQEITTQAKELLATIKDLIQSPVQPIEVDLTVDTIQLTGELTSLYSEGFVSYRPGNCKGKDMLHLWINHLVLNLLQPDGVALHSYHAGKDKCICFKPVDQPEKELLTLLHYFREGQQEPLHFYPQTSYCWAKAKEEERMKKAHSSWNPGYNHNGEQDDLAYAIGLRGQNPLDTHFTELAALFFPIIKASEKHCATA